MLVLDNLCPNSCMCERVIACTVYMLINYYSVFLNCLSVWAQGQWQSCYNTSCRTCCERNCISHGSCGERCLKSYRTVKNLKFFKVINKGNSAPNMHKSSECYFRNETCWKCGKVGHIKRVCRSGKSQNCTRRRKEEKPNLHAFKVDDERDDDTCSLVALLEANNFNHVAAGDVIWWHQTMEFDTLTQAQQY